MKNNASTVFIASIVGAFTSFLLFAIIYFIYTSSPWATAIDAYSKIVLFFLVLVLPIGGFVAGRIAGNWKLGIFSGLFASLGFFLFSLLLIILTFYWDYSYNLFLFFEGIGIDTSTVTPSDITGGFIWGYGLLISGIFAGASVILNSLSGFIGGKTKSNE